MTKNNKAINRQIEILARDKGEVYLKEEQDWLRIKKEDLRSISMADLLAGTKRIIVKASLFSERIFICTHESDAVKYREKKLSAVSLKNIIKIFGMDDESICKSVWFCAKTGGKIKEMSII